MDFYFIKGTYTINADGSYDVIGDVDLFSKELHEIPIMFNKVSGNFDCSDNYLTSLYGCPKEVGGDFMCAYNFITTLEFCPLIIKGSFYVSSNKLVTLKGCANEIGRHFDCADNKLTSLEFKPSITHGDLDCSDNDLCNFIGIGTVKGRFQFDYKSSVYEIFKLCPRKEFIKYLNEFTPIRGKTILGKRLQDCLYMCDIEDVDVTKLSFKNYTLLE